MFAGGDAGSKEAVLNALWGDPFASPEMGPGIVKLALEGAENSAPEVRTEACYVFMNQAAWKVDVSDAIEPLLKLLQDENSRVRHQAGYAVGNIAKARYDMSRHIAPLVSNLSHEDKFVRNSNAWALWQLSKAKHDISAAVSALIGLLRDTGEYNQPRKNAAGALVHHAKKSQVNCAQVKNAAAISGLASDSKESSRFLDQLANLP